MRKVVLGCMAAFFLVFSFSAFAEDVQKISSLKAKDAVAYIKSLPHGKKLVFVYTSWCPYCREKMPDVMFLAHQKKDSVVALSVDNDKGALAYYLSGFKTPDFPVIHVDQQSGMRLSDAFRTAWGTQWDRGIPFMILLSSENNLVKSGNFSVEEASRYIFDDSQE
jgi:thiol-disulfide isomerase/thioredoxin